MFLACSCFVNTKSREVPGQVSVLQHASMKLFTYPIFLAVLMFHPLPLFPPVHVFFIDSLCPKGCTVLKKYRGGKGS